ncbi:MAG: dethiobiotin synthase [Candidatus Omnitrophica bacterium]|nr:dethiobiotin synthase [Candidatus Omnitrophota bacterium]
MKKQSFFITGTDTGSGKTIATGLLGRYFKDAGKKVITQKWVQTGDKNISSDILAHLDLMDITFEQISKIKDLVMPYIFEFPASPHLAAIKAGCRINVEKIKRSYFDLMNDFDVILVEGSGGVMVPIAEDVLMIDICSELNIPAILVIGNKLGAINHSLLTIGALREKKIDLTGLVFNNICNETPSEILNDNMKIIEKITGERIIGIIDNFRGKQTASGSLKIKGNFKF